MKIFWKAALAGLAFASALPAEAGTLKLAHSTWVGYGPFYIARDKGFFKEEGVDVELSIMEDTPLKMGAFMAGQLDMVASTADEFPIYLKDGKSIRYVLAVDNSKGGDGIVSNKEINSVADLKGKKIGVAGTAIDKSWILLRAYTRKTLGKDITEIAEPVFGAAPLITEEFKAGRLDACLNFWTYAARLAGAGARQLIGMVDVLKALEVSPAPPLVGFIWSEKAAKDKGIPVDALLAAAHDANDVLAKSEPAWERLKPLVKPASDEEFASIKAYFRSGITSPWTAEQTAAAEKLTKLLIELGDTELVGDGTRFDANLFHTAAG